MCPTSPDRYSRKSGMSTEDSWIPLSDIPTTSNELIERFHCRHTHAPRPPTSIFTPTVQPEPAPTDSASSALQTSTPASSEPPASASAPVLPTPAPVLAPAPTSAVPAYVPRPLSPPTVRVNPRAYYEPPTQTTTRSGRVSRPLPRPDAWRPGG